MTNEPTTPLVTPAEFAQIHGYGVQSVCRLLRKGRLPGERWGQRGWLIPRDAKIALLKPRRQHLTPSERADYENLIYRHHYPADEALKMIGRDDLVGRTHL